MTTYSSPADAPLIAPYYSRRTGRVVAGAPALASFLNGDKAVRRPADKLRAPSVSPNALAKFRTEVERHVKRSKQPLVIRFLSHTVIVAVLIGIVGVTSGSAGEQLQIVTQEQLTVGAPGGTFTFTGDISDSGTFTLDSFFRTNLSAAGGTTVHIIQTYSGQGGTLTMNNQCLSVFDGSGSFIDSCAAVVIDGTGTYQGLHGQGLCSGVINLITGIATRICQFRLNS